LLADPHYADRDPANERHYRDSLAKLQECVEVMNDEKVDFLIEMGDFKDQDAEPVEENTLGYLKTIESCFHKFTGPRYHVLGNHDMDSLSKQQVLQQIENSGISNSRAYYSYESGGFHFVVLDANFTRENRDYDHGNFDWTDANIRSVEMQWLTEDLSRTARPVVVFVHQLLDGQGEHYIRNAAEVRAILQKSENTFAVFQGHYHQGQYSKIAGIHYITLAAMVTGAGPENNRYYIVEISPELEINITGYRKGNSMQLVAKKV